MTLKLKLKFPSFNYALTATELLYNLRTEYLPEMLDLKRSLGLILGQLLKPKQMTYEQREQFFNLSRK